MKQSQEKPRQADLEAIKASLNTLSTEDMVELAAHLEELINERNAPQPGEEGYPGLMDEIFPEGSGIQSRALKAAVSPEQAVSGTPDHTLSEQEATQDALRRLELDGDQVADDEIEEA